MLYEFGARSNVHKTRINLSESNKKRPTTQMVLWAVLVVCMLCRLCVCCDVMCMLCMLGRLCVCCVCYVLCVCYVGYMPCIQKRIIDVLFHSSGAERLPHHPELERVHFAAALHRLVADVVRNIIELVPGKQVRSVRRVTCLQQALHYHLFKIFFFKLESIAFVLFKDLRPLLYS